MLFCVLIVAATTVTAQSKLWLHGNKVINLSNSNNITVTDLPTPTGQAGLVYNGAQPERMAHVEYDINGNILFFMIDGRIYNKDGYLLVKRQTTSNESLDYYPEEMLNYGVIRVPNHCDKFYLFASHTGFEVVGPAASHFMVALLDLSLSNHFYPNDPDKSGALVNWNTIGADYPVDLTQMNNLPPLSSVDVRGCTVFVNLNILVPGVALNGVNICLFSAIAQSSASVLLNTSQYLDSFHWRVEEGGITFLEKNDCNFSETDVVTYFERRSFAQATGGAISCFNGARTPSPSRMSGFATFVRTLS